MVCGSDNGREDQCRVRKPEHKVEGLPEKVLSALALLQLGAEDAGVVQERAADAEGVAEVHARHRCEAVDVLAAHPDRLRVVVADGVEEAVLFRQEPGWHAGVEDEDYECEEVGEGHGATDGGEGRMRGRQSVVPSNETDRTGDVDECIHLVEDGERILVTVHEPLLNVLLLNGEQNAQPAELLCFEYRKTVCLGNGPNPSCRK